MIRWGRGGWRVTGLQGLESFKIQKERGFIGFAQMNVGSLTFTFCSYSHGITSEVFHRTNPFFLYGPACLVFSLKSEVEIG